MLRRQAKKNDMKKEGCYNVLSMIQEVKIL